MEVLMTITHGRHEFFQKDYRPATLHQQVATMPIDNEDNFFTGLPYSTAGMRRNNFAALKPDEKKRLDIVTKELKLERLRAKFERSQRELERALRNPGRGGIEAFSVEELLRDVQPYPQFMEEQQPQPNVFRPHGAAGPEARHAHPNQQPMGPRGHVAFDNAVMQEDFGAANENMQAMQAQLEEVKLDNEAGALGGEDQPVQHHHAGRMDTRRVIHARRMQNQNQNVPGNDDSQ